MKRRKFLKNSTLTAAGILSTPILTSCNEKKEESGNKKLNAILPIVVCTWNFKNATAKAWDVISKGGLALDAVELGVMVEEADPTNDTVGMGGRSDRDGQVTLDACIMDKDSNCGSVVYLKNIVHPASAARKDMENTPHIILAGRGAEKFAYENGFKKTNLLTESTKRQYKDWKKTSQYETIINIENHDTIGMLWLDKDGDIAGACTTSGLSYKMKGRVGDSPIIGSGLFVDNQVGGAAATGLGEEILKTVGSFLIVELMRNGMHPQQACEEAVRRVTSKNPNYKDFQVAYIAINKAGETGAYCIHEGFRYMKYQDGVNHNILSECVVKA